MGILEKLKHQESLIEDINGEIDDILNEVKISGIEVGEILPTPFKVVKGIVDYADDMVRGDLDLVDQYGNKIASINKDAASTADDIDGMDADTDVSKEIDWEDPALAAALVRFNNNKEWLEQHYSQQTTPQSTGTSPYSSAKINFRGRDMLTVNTGSGKEIEQYIGGTMDFDVMSFKKTDQGFILNLFNSGKFNRDTSLLLYTRDLSSKPQTNRAQLIAKNGKFIGSPKKISFTIMSIK